jgi:methylthioribose-1-phosphate isomerase
MSEEQFSGLKSIRVSEDGHKIEIVNQLLLPHTTAWVEVTSVEDCHHVIKSMKVRTACCVCGDYRSYVIH